MSKPHCLVIGPATDAMMAGLTEAFSVHRVPPEDLGDVVSNHGDKIQYLLSNGHGGVSADLMDRLPDLRAISNYGVGYDTVDIAAAISRGVIVTHTPDVLNDEVANTALMLLLTVARNFLADNAYVRAGRWPTEGNAPLSRSISAMKVGILGLGRIGKAFADKLGKFGCEVAYHGRSQQDVPYRYYDDLTAMAQDIDALVCIAPGGASTKHLIGRKVLDALGPDGILINVGRGSVVDEVALIAALRDGRLGSAGLDVFENEPQVPAELIDMAKVTLLPHVGSATVETRAAMGDLAVRNLTQFQSTGRAVTPVPECKGN